MKTPTLSPELLDRLRRFAEGNGRTWRAKLREVWLRGDEARYPDSHLLRQLRNAVGPSGLDRVELYPGKPKPKVKRDGTVELAGRTIGTVRKERRRTTHMNDGAGGLNYAVGFSYRTEWFGTAPDGKKMCFGIGASSRARVVEELVDYDAKTAAAAAGKE
jgi:hypothetical protein